MELLQGPFRFQIDDQCTPVEWAELSDSLKLELTKDNEFNEENSKIYRCGLAIFEEPASADGNNDWKEVRRICIEAKTPSRGMAILGISPRDKKTADLSQNSSHVTLEGGIKLFDALKMKFSLGQKAKNLATEDKYAVLASFVRRYAQWVYSTGWRQKNMDMHVYVVVPNSLIDSDRYILISAHALRKNNVLIRSVSVVEQKMGLSA